MLWMCMWGRHKCAAYAGLFMLKIGTAAAVGLEQAHGLCWRRCLCCAALPALSVLCVYSPTKLPNYKRISILNSFGDSFLSIPLTPSLSLSLSLSLFLPSLFLPPSLFFSLLGCRDLLIWRSLLIYCIMPE